MKVKFNTTMPRPTPRNEVVPGMAYLYRLGSHTDHVVFAIQDERVFNTSETFLVDIEDGEVWSGDSGELYEIDAELVVKESP